METATKKTSTMKAQDLKFTQLLEGSNALPYTRRRSHGNGDGKTVGPSNEFRSISIWQSEIAKLFFIG
ncbi:MAG: hypothetical protein A2498_15085 [Lentisphaerae bacterium RIFOXYC12_FULL_60_16]|nr:MAG: hypothetical protein A2498_15085 [Lentisphaerae bacterium RIFOXYC12_FULL_60_16]